MSIASWFADRLGKKKYVDPVHKDDLLVTHASVMEPEEPEVETMQLGIGETVPLPIGAFRYRIGSATKVAIGDQFMGTGNYGMVEVVGLDHNIAFCYVKKVLSVKQ